MAKDVTATTTDLAKTVSSGAGDILSSVKQASADVANDVKQATSEMSKEAKKASDNVADDVKKVWVDAHDSRDHRDQHELRGFIPLIVLPVTIASSSLGLAICYPRNLTLHN